MWTPVDYVKKRRTLFLVPPQKDTTPLDEAPPQASFQSRFTQALAVGERVVLRTAEIVTVCAMSPTVRVMGLATMQVLTCGVTVFFELERIVVETLSALARGETWRRERK